MPRPMMPVPMIATVFMRAYCTDSWFAQGKSFICKYNPCFQWMAVFFGQNFVWS
jgi:hypothetical protein